MAISEAKQIRQSGATQSGYLSTIDWNTFNDKQDALTNGVDLLTSGEVIQLSNIGATTIDLASWTAVGGMNQGVATGDSVTFAGLTVPLIISSANLDLKSTSSTGLVRILDNDDAVVFSYNNNTDTFTFNDDLDVTIGGEINVNTINTYNSIAGVTIEDVQLNGGVIKVDTINELTGGVGVTIDSVLCKDGGLVLDLTANITAIDILARPDGNHNAIIIHKDGSTKNSIIHWHDDDLGAATWYMGEWGSRDWKLKNRVFDTDAIVVKSSNSDVLLPTVYSDTVSSSPRILSIDSTGKLGVSTTANPVFANIIASGYINQAGISAEIYVADASTAQSIATGVTYTKSTAFTTDGQSSNCTSDAANDKITITQLGKYTVTASVSATSGSAAVTFRGAAFLNGVEQDQCHFKRKYQTATDSGSASFSGDIDVTSVPWDLDLRFRHDNGGAINYTVEYANLHVKYWGAT